jgi:hypothetical protein
MDLLRKGRRMWAGGDEILGSIKAGNVFDTVRNLSCIEGKVDSGLP